MTEDQLKQIERVVGVAIEKHVNGKIRDLSRKMDDYIRDDSAWKLVDKTWKVRAEPAVKAFENTTWLGDLAIKFLKLVGLLGTGIVAYITIKNLFK